MDVPNTELELIQLKYLRNCIIALNPIKLRTAECIDSGKSWLPAKAFL